MSWKSIDCEEDGMYREWGDADGRPTLKENTAYGDVDACSHWKWIKEEA